MQTPIKVAAPFRHVITYMMNDVARLIRGLRGMDLDHDRPRAQRRYHMVEGLKAVIPPNAGRDWSVTLEFDDPEDQRLANDALALV